MRFDEAKWLRTGDEVTLKRTGRKMQVVSVVVTEKEQASTLKKNVSVLLNNGKWYTYRQIR